MKMDKENKRDMREEYDFSKGKRGRYANRITLSDTAPKNCKVDIMLSLDADIIEYFKKHSALQTPNSYKNAINNALRTFMENGVEAAFLSSLLNNDLFIQAVAEKLKAR